MIFPEEIVDLEYAAVKNGKITSVRLGAVKTKYIVLILYPLDFTFVCPTEITKFSAMNEEFLREGASIFFVSGDSVYSHLAWIEKMSAEYGIDGIHCPMISDMTHSLSSQFGLFNEKTGTVCRSTVIMNKDLEVLHISANVDPIGRSSAEVLRLVKAMNFHAKHGDVCPIDFEKKIE